MPESLPELSVVIPVFNEEGNIIALYERLVQVLKGLTPEYEIWFVDDGSSDQSFRRVSELHVNDPRVSGISLSRNCGHQIALLAGLHQAKGNAIVSLDGDLQHPPELIPELYEKYLEGHDIVNTRRIDPPGTGIFKRWSSRLYYKLINTLSDVYIEPASADFRLMSRKALDAYLALPERDRFTRGLISWIGFDQCIIPYQAEARFSGRSKYSLRKMLRFGMNGITSFSSKPLRFSFYSGVVFSTLGVVYGIYALIEFLKGTTMPGWTSILLTLLVIGGIIMINLGIIGEYIARIYHEVKARPHYFIRQRTGESELRENDIL